MMVGNLDVEQIFPVIRIALPSCCFRTGNRGIQEAAQEDGRDPVFRDPRRHGRYDFGWPVIAPGIGF